MKEQFIEQFKTIHRLYTLGNSKIPQSIQEKIDKYFEEITEKKDIEELLESFDECYPEVEFILKDYIYGFNN